MTSRPAPFLGRSSLLELVQDHLRHGHHVLLQGAAGIGKTCLAGQALKDDRASATRVDRLLANESRADVLLSVLAPLGPPPSVAVEDQAAVLGWFLRRWRERGNGNGPAVVWVDDIHHCDHLSEAVLRQAVTSQTVQLLATHRIEEPLGAGVQALINEGLLLPLLVDPLDRNAATDLVRAMADQPLPKATLRKVNALTVGNPLFIREVVGAMNGGLHVDSSTTLKAIVGRPLTTLSQGSRRLLDLIAVAEPLPENVLRHRWQDVRELLDRGVVTRQSDGTVRLDHPMRREWVLHHLGSRRPDVFAELLDLALAHDGQADVDPTTIVEWQLQAGRDPDPTALQVATRQAIGRHDSETALRFVPALRGSVATLLRGQALLSAGQGQAGLSALSEVVQTGPEALRAEAAFWQARHIGLVLGDYARAQAVLDAVDDPHLPTALRRFVLTGRLWLWIFGPVGDRDSLQLAQEFAVRGPHDERAFELCCATAAVLNQVTDPVDLEPLLSHCATLEQAVPLTTQTVGRAQTVRMWWETSRGEGERAKRVARAAYEQAVSDHDLETIALLVGSAGWFWALAGHIEQACAVSGAAHRLPRTDDWFNYRTLGILIDHGNRSLSGESVETDNSTTFPDAAVGADSLVNQGFRTRARALAAQVHGRAVDENELALTLSRLIEGGKHLWVANLGLEVTSLTTGAAVHDLLRQSGCRVPAPGLVAVGGRAARARLNADAETLLMCGQDLEWAGLSGLAMRVMADVAVLSPPQSPTGRQSRTALMRLLRTWDGAYPRWLPSLDTVPTQRQRQIAWKVVGGASTADIAAESFLSVRTVENHLHRVYQRLHVHGREELTELLQIPPRPSLWRFGAVR